MLRYPHMSVRGRTRPKVGISGHHRFVSLFMRAASAAPEWDLSSLDVRTWRARLSSLREFLRCDVWYTIGTGKATVWFEILAFVLCKPRVVHWVGSDILALGRFPLYRLLWQLRGSRTTTHVAEVDWTARELQTHGLRADEIMLPLHLGSGKPVPLPPVFTILFYIPAKYESFYGIEHCERLVEAFRGRPVAFIVIGGGRLRTDGNGSVTHITWAGTAEEIDDAYARSTLMIRMTPHDGLSCMVLEALSRGRYVVWTHPFPHAYQAQSFDDMRSYVEGALARFTAGELPTNDNAAAFVQEEYEAAKSVRALSAHWRNVLLPSARGHEPAKNVL